MGYFFGRRSAGVDPLTFDTVDTLMADKEAEQLAAKAAQKPMDPFKGGQMVSTWNHGLSANDAGMSVINNGGSALDAVEAGARKVEADPQGNSVGIGGLPDREGHVTLDACIMDHTGNAGSVTAIEGIQHPASVARFVMEQTPHVMLTADGARKVALEMGMESIDLLTPESKEAWEEWRKESNYEPIINVENHDTIGILAQDQRGNLSGCCTTSGLAFKLRGRVGDSPIIGAGLFVDNAYGAATATGLGEAVMKSCGSFLIVELMRQGMTPNEACKEAVERIVRKQPNHTDFQVGYIAMRKDGLVGSYAVQSGFNFALHKGGENKMYKVRSYLT